MVDMVIEFLSSSAKKRQISLTFKNNVYLSFTPTRKYYEHYYENNKRCVPMKQLLPLKYPNKCASSTLKQ